MSRRTLFFSSLARARREMNEVYAHAFSSYHTACRSCLPVSQANCQFRVAYFKTRKCPETTRRAKSGGVDRNRAFVRRSGQHETARRVVDPGSFYERYVAQGSSCISRRNEVKFFRLLSSRRRRDAAAYEASRT